jgi:hypothetical protein
LSHEGGGFGVRAGREDFLFFIFYLGFGIWDFRDFPFSIFHLSFFIFHFSYDLMSAIFTKSQGMTNGNDKWNDKWNDKLNEEIQEMTNEKWKMENQRNNKSQISNRK